jgi:hypothetical protein
MSPDLFAVICFLGFAVPIPLLVWLDRPRGGAR